MDTGYRLEPHEIGEEPIAWSSDGTELSVYRPGDIPARIFAVDLATGVRSLERELAPADLAGVVGIDFVSLAPDSGAHVFSFKRLISELYLIDGRR